MGKVDELAQIMDSLYEFERIMQAYQNISRQYGTEDYLYMTETHTIQEIGNNPGQTLNQLAEKTFRTNSGMSLLIKNLSKKGLVLRTRDPENNRKYMITLTPKGEIVYNFHKAMDDKDYNYFISQLEKNENYTSDDLARISQFLISLNQIINEFHHTSTNEDI